MSKILQKKVITLALLCAIALLSILVISKLARNPETYTATIQSIDEKKGTVMGLTASAALVSTALASIPGDATTPIANQIMEISAYLLVVVCVLVLEKSLLTVMGYIAFNILIPVACVLFALFTLFGKSTFKVWATKFTVFALVIVTIIPFSLKISDLIYEINKETIEQLSTSVNENVEDTSQEDTWLDSILDKVKDSITDVKEQAKKVLNTFVDAIAIFIITYCVIPILVVAIVLWFIKFLFGITVPVPQINKSPFFNRHTDQKNDQELQEVKS